MIPRRNNYRHKPCKWYSASCKYTYPSRIRAGSQEQAAESIGLQMNADKIEYICFNQGHISTLNGGFLKLVDKFTYLGSSVSSTESDINMCQTKAWTAIDRPLLIWKSDLSH